MEVVVPSWIVGVVTIVCCWCNVEAMTVGAGGDSWQLPQRVAPLGKPALLPPLPPQLPEHPYNKNNRLPEPHPSAHPLPPSQQRSNSNNIHNMHEATMITSKCSCGGLQLKFPATAPSTETCMADCHCPACRRYHVAAVVRYIRVDEGLQVTGDTAQTYTDRCQSLGSVTRTFCRRCHSKLLTTKHAPESDASSAYIPPEQYVNMGPIDDTTVPPMISQHWSSLVVEQWQAHMAVAWATARPRFNPGKQKPKADSIVRGGCTCTTGAAFSFTLQAPTEVQHCYCYLCRQLSGGLYMTWMPVFMGPQQFSWTTASGAPPTQRYTNLGERHVCRKCGGVVSIAYDYEAERTVWMAVGSFDAVSLPYNLAPYLERAAHICCRYRPGWIEAIPDDVEQIPDAS